MNDRPEGELADLLDFASWEVAYLDVADRIERMVKISLLARTCRNLSKGGLSVANDRRVESLLATAADTNAAELISITAAFDDGEYRNQYREEVDALILLRSEALLPWLETAQQVVQLGAIVAQVPTDTPTRNMASRIEIRDYPSLQRSARIAMLNEELAPLLTGEIVARILELTDETPTTGGDV